MKGGIITILSPDENKSKEIALKFGKLQDSGDILMYYRKQGDYILSTLVPKEYPSSIINSIKASSLSNKIIIVHNEYLDWRDGELLLLANSTGTKSLATHSDTDKLKKLIESSNLSNIEINRFLDEKSNIEAVEPRYEKFVYIDRSFTVKGVGAVMLGFSFMDIKVHDTLIALPSMQRVEIKNIQVLDEDQVSVNPGVRIGIALRNVKAEDVKDTYALVPDENNIKNNIKDELIKYPWSEIKLGSTYHFIAGGISVTGIIKAYENREIDVELSKPIPNIKRIIIADVNAKNRKPRIIGYLNTNFNKV
ncbi:MAG: translation elongation factor [Caldisphaera sp.]|jgi:selenocysteine-specific translation elongation factor|nr:hypothetical protein [Caldisphaera sp.]PMP59450.1 MAG: translation elongation factor [Caldisphaera sp.]PMP88955.1 MAG: translation elongation factor [Caldisphaera sp.]